MAENQLTDAAATALGGTTDPDFDTGVAYPAANADPWLIPFYQFGYQILNALAEVANNLRVFNDDAGGTTIGVTPGRCTINGVVTTYAGGTISLTDNDTTYIWLTDGGAGAGALGSAIDGTGWTGSDHIKLAEVTVASGEVTAILDRRVEQMLHD